MPIKVADCPRKTLELQKTPFATKVPKILLSFLLSVAVCYMENIIYQYAAIHRLETYRFAVHTSMITEPVVECVCETLNL